LDFHAQSLIRRAKVADAEPVHAVLLSAKDDIPLADNFGDAACPISSAERGVLDGHLGGAVEEPAHRRPKVA
jgi:hypothetical protein